MCGRLDLLKVPGRPAVPLDPGAPDGPLLPESPLGPGRPRDPGLPTENEDICNIQISALLFPSQNENVNFVMIYSPSFHFKPYFCRTQNKILKIF